MLFGGCGGLLGVPAEWGLGMLCCAWLGGEEGQAGGGAESGGLGCSRPRALVLGWSVAVLEEAG